MRRFRRGAALGTLLVTAFGCGSDDPNDPASSGRQLELRSNRHGGVFMGVRCYEPNSVRCDRVGLAVWLAKPAESLVAEIRLTATYADGSTATKTIRAPLPPGWG